MCIWRGPLSSAKYQKTEKSHCWFLWFHLWSILISQSLRQAAQDSIPVPVP